VKLISDERGIPPSGRLVMKTWIILVATVLTCGVARGAFAGSSPFTPPPSAQLAPTPSPESASPAPGASSGGRELLAGWDVSLDGRVGVPSGSVRVGEKPVKGTGLGLQSDLGMGVSEVLEASLGYHFTPQDAIRLTYLQYFLNRSSTINHPFTYNGQLYGPGHVASSLGFNWLNLAYERVLFALANGGSLTGSAGVRYVSLDAVVRGNHEDFYRQELPVPIVGFRFIYPIDHRWALTADVSGGGLPRVDSLRQEGGAVYLNQTHADAGVSLTYAITPALQAHAGYHLTYFLQHEKSHEDDNRFELIDNGLQFGLKFRF
jgi:hypothetical protein